MNLELAPGRYRKGEYVYTCTQCGREGEAEWMNEHLKLAEDIASAREREQVMRMLPKRKEFVNIRGGGV